jgi:NhaP-type Na+/H+ or K+/H+ antiporter
VHPFPLAIAVVSAIIFILGQMSQPLANRFFASPPLLAMAIGVLLGPQVLGWVDASGLSASSLEELTRIALAVGVMGIALQVPQDHLIRALGGVAILILGVMPPTRWPWRRRCSTSRI